MKYAAYMTAKRAPIAKHCNEITSQNNIGLSYIETTTPTPICICIVRRLLSNFKAVNANAISTTTTMDITCIGAVARC